MEKIVVVGAGYVGLANAFLMGISNKITLIDLDEKKINMLNDGKSPINDKYINDYISKVNVDYTTDEKDAYKDADIVFVAVNTNYNEETNCFELGSLNKAIESISNYVNEGTTIVIKSTVPVNYTSEVAKKYNKLKFIFSPEFLREGFALYDNLHPDRIIIGSDNQDSNINSVVTLLSKNVLKEDVPIIYTSTKEAEVIKLFANTYLAMRVAFVNELDTYCQKQGIASESILKGIGTDKRIGMQYFNPSFGYGGYCLPKDTKQLKNEFVKNDVPENLISSIVDSNQTRKEFIVSVIEEKVNFDKEKVIGFNRLVAKKGINNFRQSAIVDIMFILKDKGYKINVYEPYLKEEIENISIYNNFEAFSSSSDLILTNRQDENTRCLSNVFSVDVFNDN